MRGRIPIRAVESSPPVVECGTPRHGQGFTDRVIAAVVLGSVLAACSTGQNAEAAGKMLEDVPLPAGFDIAAVKSGAGGDDRYQVAVSVIGPVACAWMKQWVDARESGDAGAEAEAVAALGSSHSWAILLEMSAQGGWPNALWQYADAIATSGTVVAGEVLSVDESYVRAFGCPE